MFALALVAAVWLGTQGADPESERTNDVVSADRAAPGRGDSEFGPPEILEAPVGEHVAVDPVEPAVHDDPGTAGAGTAPDQHGETAAPMTAGYELGQTRARIVFVQRRIDRYRENLARLEADGDEQAAARQRLVIENGEARLAQMEGQVVRLRQEATRDGTLADDGRAYDETVANQVERRVIPIEAVGSPRTP